MPQSNKDKVQQRLKAFGKINGDEDQRAIGVVIEVALQTKLYSTTGNASSIGGPSSIDNAYSPCSVSLVGGYS